MDSQGWLLLALSALTIGFWLNLQINGLMRRYLRVRTATWVNVSHLAKVLLDQKKITHVKIEPLSSMIDDHYDAFRRRLRLSDPTGHSIAEFAMTAQETGLVIQQVENSILFWLAWGLSALARLAATLSGIGLLLGIVQGLGFWLGMVPVNLWEVSWRAYLGCVLAALPMTYVRWQVSGRILSLLSNLPEMNGDPSEQELRELSQMMNALIWRDLKDIALVLPGIVTSIKDWLTQPRR
jgi:Zn-dependent membrane protease YugP